MTVRAACLLQFPPTSSRQRPRDSLRDLRNPILFSSPDRKMTLLVGVSLLLLCGYTHSCTFPLSYHPVFLSLTLNAWPVSLCAWFSSHSPPLTFISVSFSCLCPLSSLWEGLCGTQCLWGAELDRFLLLSLHRPRRAV